MIPALCWSTSLWPIIQSGLKPKFVDVDVDTLNINCYTMLCLHTAVYGWKGVSLRIRLISSLHNMGHGNWNVTDLSGALLDSNT